MTLTPTPAAPSGELPARELQLAVALEAAHALLQRSSAYNDSNMNVFKGCVRALAAPSGAPKQDNDKLKAEVLSLHRELAGERLRADQGWARYESANAQKNKLEMAAASTVQSAPVRSNLDYETKLEQQVGALQTENDNLRALIAAAQSAPVLPECGTARQHDASFMVLIGHLIHASQEIREGAVWPLDGMILANKTGEEMRVLDGIVNNALQLASDLREAAQSTPVQVDRQQEPQAHVMPPFAAPAGQHDASFAAPAGYKLVPQMATLDMRNAAVRAADKRDTFMSTNDASVVWAAMLAAAPEQSGLAGAAKGGIDEPNGAVQAVALPVVAAPEQKP